ncbi:amidohydrolase family protein [Penicillium chermesinum]|uniref:Amidohydrolase family protein n=1 Tax=Penicillium chermesinum TaxID=63820 RepID=A0A9W9TYN9_9EURO|nr:amidohydrolase family protein [Penicillium chermesinum]KAJ5247688.1 amidohydrolase family protein [Penicillium chermesinum]
MPLRRTHNLIFGLQYQSWIHMFTSSPPYILPRWPRTMALTGGPGILERYMGKVRARAKTEHVWRKIRGVRYLVQDKPAGVMLQPPFLQGVRWIGKQGYTFDLGVDARKGGLHQLHEAVEMMRQVYDGLDDPTHAVANGISSVALETPRTICANQISTCQQKPRLPIQNFWDLVTQMARASEKTYMKLSGLFSELPPLSPDVDLDIPALIARLSPWTNVIFDVFGPDRIMFGSDWPVCNIGGGGNTVAWGRWQAVVEALLARRGLSEEQRQAVWGQTAVRAYGIEFENERVPLKCDAITAEC